jgi:hypothetical protein
LFPRIFSDVRLHCIGESHQSISRSRWRFVAVFPSRNGNPIHTKHLGELIDLQSQILSKESDLSTGENHRFEEDNFADGFHQFRRARDRHVLFAAVAARPDVHVDQVDVIQPTFEEVMIASRESNVPASA